MRSEGLAKPSRPSPVCVLCRCCPSGPIPLPRPDPARGCSLWFPGFPGSHRRPWRASLDMQLKQTDAMINHQIRKKLRSSFAVDTFHSVSTSLAERLTMGDWVPHGLEAEDRSLPRPGCRLTALLCAPDSPADGVACPKSVFCRTSSTGIFAFACFPCRWPYDSTGKRVCH